MACNRCTTLGQDVRSSCALGKARRGNNIGTTVPYWYALMEPVHGRNNKPEDFKKMNEVLFPNGTEMLDIYEWTTDWSDFFDAGHEWYGACCWSVYDRSLSRYVVMLVSATD